MISVVHWRSVLAEVDQAGLCSNPVRLRGITLDRSNGELAEGDLVVACKDRRAVVCPSCARLYQADAWQLVAAGIRGGKGVDASVVDHPQLFVTLTAPSFGPVHRGPATGEPTQTCRPRRDRQPCPHAVGLGCFARHEPGDPLVGEPLCPGCFDYRGAVLWNAHLSRLWGRTWHRLYREVARNADISVPQLRRTARLSYIKVAEFQARGLVHLHAVVRADGGSGPDEEPPSRLDAATLSDAIGRVLPAAGVPMPAVRGTDLRRARWGAQHDVRVLLSDDSADATAIAAYVAKYSVKTADGSAGLAHRIRSLAYLERLNARPHLVAMAKTAWTLGCRKDLAYLRLRGHAHTFGYRGQFASKSVRFSTTFAALRAARADYVRAGRCGDFDPDHDFEFDGGWRYAGRGYAHPEAETLAASLLEARLEVTRRVPKGSSNTSSNGSQMP
jgi:hypothetical protein